ncbi:MAG: hypothetical protein LC754_01400 [Acidobacteria bacterium]|nr:hypothetical protein [Acidobacteriota bacterium]
MKKLYTNLVLLAGALLFIGFNGSVARADIVYLGPRVVQPSGQGVVPTVLTLQENNAVPNRDYVESGAVRRVSGRDVLEGDAKRGINSKTISATVLFSDLKNGAGVLNAADLGIYLDIVEPGEDNLLTIQGRTSLVLTAYDNQGTACVNGGKPPAKCRESRNLKERGRLDERASLLNKAGVGGKISPTPAFC